MSDLTRADLLVRQEGQPWHLPSESQHGNEAALRDLLAGQPNLIPGLTDSAAAVAELAAPGTGALDVAAVSQAGEIVLVECKLSSNPEIRREVVGQILAYASAYWRMDYDTFDGLWRRRANQSLVTHVLGTDHDDADATRFRDAVGAALDTGRFALVLAVDAITPELRRIVEYLNAHTLDEISVLALELRYAREGTVEMIIPTLYGAELANSVARAKGERRRWSEQELFDQLRTEGSIVERVCRKLYDHYRQRARVMWFGEGRRPSVTANLETSNGLTQPWSIFVGDPSVIATNFEYTKPFSREARRSFVDAVAALPGVDIDPDEIERADFKRRPSIRIAGTFDQDGAIDKLIAAVDRLLSSEGPAQLP